MRNFPKGALRSFEEKMHAQNSNNYNINAVMVQIYVHTRLTEECFKLERWQKCCCPSWSVC